METRNPEISNTLLVPGDVVRFSDGSIAMIHDAEWRNKTGGMGRWSDFNNRPSGDFDGAYSVVSIPGVPCGKIAWWHDADVFEIQRGAIYKFLLRRRYGDEAQLLIPNS